MVPPPRLRRIRLTLAALLVLIGSLAWVATRPAPAAGPPQPTHAEVTVQLADVAPFGANFFLEREADPWVRRRTVEMARDAGIRWAKQQFLWSYIEQEDGVFRFEDYDTIVDLFLQNDIDVIARLDWPPDWVAKPDWVAESFRTRQNVPPADLALYARFVSATVRHFRGRVRFYQIWNEPNLISEWGFNPGHAVDPEEYTALLKAAADAARDADPNVVILAAPLAMNVESVDMAGNMSDLAYLQGMYAAGADEYFDVLSANGFGMDDAPTTDPDERTLNFRRIELQRAIMERNGDSESPIWLAEFGWNAAPADAREAYWGRVDEPTQAAWTVEALRWAEASWPWAGVFGLWYFRQWGGLDPERAVYYFRMVDTDFTPRRLYASLRTDTAHQFVAGPGIWAERSSPVKLPTDPAQRLRWAWEWSEGARDRGAIESAEPGASLGFGFRGSGVALRVLEGPQAGSVELAVDGRRVLSPSAAAVWPLQAAERQWQWLPVANGLSDGAHQLQVTVGTAGGTVAIDSFRVDAADGQAGGASGLAVALAVAAALCLGLLVFDASQAVRRLGD